MKSRSGKLRKKQRLGLTPSNSPMNPHGIKEHHRQNGQPQQEHSPSLSKVIAHNTSIKGNAQTTRIVERIMKGRCIQEEKVKRAKEKEKETGKERTTTSNVTNVVRKAIRHQNVDLPPRNQGPRTDLHPEIPNQKEKEREIKARKVDPNPRTPIKEKEKEKKVRVRSAKYVVEKITSLPIAGISPQYVKDTTRLIVRHQTARNTIHQFAITGKRAPVRKQIAYFCTEPPNGSMPNLQLLHLSRKRDLTHQHLRKPSKRPKRRKQPRIRRNAPPLKHARKQPQELSPSL